MLKEVMSAISEAGGQALKVGGCVRDYLLEIECKDIDIEVYGLTSHQLRNILSSYGNVKSVGESFGVFKIKIDGQEYDFSLPRKENKIGVGHRDFDVSIDPSMSPKEAASRRDFTFNAMMMDISGSILDPYHGQAAMSAMEIHPTSDKFLEDPLRVLRGMQFASRFNYHATDLMKEYGHKLVSEFPFISKDRVWGEWYKWATKSIKPSAGIQFLQDVNWLQCFPHLFRMQNCIQDSTYHPEGCCLTHTKYVMDYASKLCYQYSIEGDDRAVILFAALLHDVGKPDTTIFKDGRIRSPRHAEVGVNIAHEFLESIKSPHHIIDRVLPLVKYHMVHIGVEPTNRFVRRLVNNLYPATVPELTTIIKSDIGGRPPLDPTPSASVIGIDNIFANLKDEIEGRVKPIVQGRHLIELGIEPGPNMGAILKEVYEHQLNDGFSSLEDGIAFASTLKDKYDH